MSVNVLFIGGPWDGSLRTYMDKPWRIEVPILLHAATYWLGPNPAPAYRMAEYVPSKDAPPAGEPWRYEWRDPP